MRNFIAAEKQKIDRSTRQLWYRRINWRSETRQRVLNAFGEVVAELRDQSYPFTFYVSGSGTPNEETVQLTAGVNITGARNRKTEITERGLSESDAVVTESGSALVASQSVTGTIAFILYPYKSERIQKTEENLILYYDLDPLDVTPALVRKAIRSYFLYMRTTTVYGFHGSASIYERFLLFLMQLRDVRNKSKMLHSFATMTNEWGKAILAAAVAYAVAVLTNGCKP